MDAPSQAQTGAFKGLEGLVGGFMSERNAQRDADLKLKYLQAQQGASDPYKQALLDLQNRKLAQQAAEAEANRVSKEKIALNRPGTPGGPSKKIPTGTNVRDLAQFPVDIQNLQGLEGKFEENKDVLGPWAGRMASVGQYAPSEVGGVQIQPEGFARAREVQASVDNLKQTIGKLKEGGVLREHDEEKYKKILATIYDEPKLAAYKIRSILDEMSQKYNETISALSAQGYDTAGLTPIQIKKLAARVTPTPQTAPGPSVDANAPRIVSRRPVGPR